MKAMAAGAAVAALDAPKLLVYAICSAPGVAGAVVGVEVGAAGAGDDDDPPPPHATASTPNATAKTGQSLEIRMRPPGERKIPPYC